MKNRVLARVHIIEPHPDDAMGSAAALCFNPKIEAVIHTISGGGDGRGQIKLDERKESRGYIAEHYRYLIQDYDWSLRLDKKVSYVDALKVYRKNYPKEQMSKLTRRIKKIIGQVLRENAHLAIPLGIMHPMHMLVSCTAFDIMVKEDVDLKKVWIYIDHPYDLHSLGSTLMRQSVLFAEEKLGRNLVRYDAYRMDQEETGEILRTIYNDECHAEFDGAFRKTLCGFYIPDRAGKERKTLVDLQKINVLMVTAQVQPFIKGGGMSNVVYGLLRNLQNYVNDARVLVPWTGVALEIGELDKRQKFEYHFSNGLQTECILEVRKYQGITYYFLAVCGVLKTIEEPFYYALFAEIVLEKVLPEMDYIPDILHCHDWHSGMLPFLIKAKYNRDKFYKKMKILYTIHFYGYQGVCRQKELRKLLPLPEDEKIDDMFRKIRYLTKDAKKMASVQETELITFMNAGIHFADCVSTVSKGYAKEMRSYPAFQSGPKILGIRNGISYDLYDPSTDPNLFYHYDSKTFEDKKAAIKKSFQKCMGLTIDKKSILICVVSRLERIKGIDSLVRVLPDLLRLPLQFVIMGDETGTEYYRAFFEKIKIIYPEKFVYLPFKERMETEIYAASDVVLVPSLSESCGSVQMIAMHYGVIPVVSALSSLKDTVTLLKKEKIEKGVGYWTYPDDCWMLYEVMVKVLQDFQDKKKWNYMVWKCMVTDFSWENKAMKKYVLLYHHMLLKRKK